MATRTHEEIVTGWIEPGNGHPFEVSRQITQALPGVAEKFGVARTVIEPEVANCVTGDKELIDYIDETGSDMRIRGLGRGRIEIVLVHPRIIDRFKDLWMVIQQMNAGIVEVTQPDWMDEDVAAMGRDQVMSLAVGMWRDMPDEWKRSGEGGEMSIWEMNRPYDATP